LLAQYVANVVLNERAAEQLRLAPVTPEGKPSPWLVVAEKTHRATVALALRLRLSPQARMPKPINVKGPPTMSYYEQMELDDEEQPR
jgi:hypothetical protein